MEVKQVTKEADDKLALKEAISKSKKMKKFVAIINVGNNEGLADFVSTTIEAPNLHDARKLLNIKYEGRVHTVDVHTVEKAT